VVSLNLAHPVVRRWQSPRQRHA